MGSYELMDHNLIGTIRVLELCKKIQAGFVLISTSRVYSVDKLAALKVEGAFEDGRSPQPLHAGGWATAAPSEMGDGGDAGGQRSVVGISDKGISENFSTEPPLSLYGASKRCAEVLAMEYGDAFGFPVWINRCGVLAGKGQFGKADQGIFSFWIRSWKENRPLRYIGFGGKGAQVRDCLHPVDLLPALNKQMKAGGAGLGLGLGLGKAGGERGQAGKIGIGDCGLGIGGSVDYRICNFGGGVKNSCSLAQLSGWCEKRFGARKVESDSKPRPYDLPWVVLDSSRAERLWGFEVRTRLETIFEEIGGD
jgi:CDP-paratose 2-epimerase